MSAARLLARFAPILLAAGLFPAFGKSAEDYFHAGSYKYVAGKIQDARVEVEEGLRHYPNDPRLRGLAGQLQDPKDPKKNPPGGQGQGKDKDSKGQNKSDPKQQEKDKDKDGGKKPEDEKKKDGQPPEPREGNGDKNPEKGKNPLGAPPPGQMSEEEAKRLLNSFADDEKKEQRERQKRLRERMETDQDW
jgi:hypothetical protein